MKRSASGCGNENARGVAHLESREPWGTRRRIMGVWHRALRSIFLPNLTKMTWRFNDRKNPFLFRDTMLKLIHSEKARIQGTDESRLMGTTIQFIRHIAQFSNNNL